jgi:hypothetical protein
VTIVHASRPVSAPPSGGCLEISWLVDSRPLARSLRIFRTDPGAHILRRRQPECRRLPEESHGGRSAQSLCGRHGTGWSQVRRCCHGLRARVLPVRGRRQFLLGLRVQRRSLRGGPAGLQRCSQLDALRIPDHRLRRRPPGSAGLPYGTDPHGPAGSSGVGMHRCRSRLLPDLLPVHQRRFLVLGLRVCRRRLRAGHTGL